MDFVEVVNALKNLFKHRNVLLLFLLVAIVDVRGRFFLPHRRRRRHHG
jgi:hypothetical protein